MNVRASFDSWGSCKQSASTISYFGSTILHKWLCSVGMPTTLKSRIQARPDSSHTVQLRNIKFQFPPRCLGGRLLSHLTPCSLELLQAGQTALLMSNPKVWKGNLLLWRTRRSSYWLAYFGKVTGYNNSSIWWSYSLRQGIAIMSWRSLTKLLFIATEMPSLLAT